MSIAESRIEMSSQGYRLLTDLGFLIPNFQLYLPSAIDLVDV